MRHTNSALRRGLTLLEILLATIVLTVLATVVMAYVRQPSERVKRASCDLRIQQLELHSRQYVSDHGRHPSSNLRELSDARYLGEPLPVCPVDGRAYRLDRRSGTIISHAHP